MNDQTEFDSVEDQTIEVLPTPDPIELSFSDLDMVGGGTGMLLFG